jgi:hypothetical protein
MRNRGPEKAPLDKDPRRNPREYKRNPTNGKGNLPSLMICTSVVTPLNGEYILTCAREGFS